MFGFCSFYDDFEEARRVQADHNFPSPDNKSCLTRASAIKTAVPISVHLWIYFVHSIWFSPSTPHRQRMVIFISHPAGKSDKGLVSLAMAELCWSGHSRWAVAHADGTYRIQANLLSQPAMLMDIWLTLLFRVGRSFKMLLSKPVNKSPTKFLLGTVVIESGSIDRQSGYSFCFISLRLNGEAVCFYFHNPDSGKWPEGAN